MAATESEQRRYDVALSFAGEDRSHARKLARELIKASVRVFYDEYEQANLWGSDLSVELHNVYSKDSQYVILFVSRHYVKKKWTVKERTAAMERALEEQGRPYILPVQIDNTEVPGLPNTLGYVPISLGIEEICRLFLKKLGADRLLAYNQSLPQYGGTTKWVLPRKMVEDFDFDEQELIAVVDERMRTGHMVEFPSIEFGGVAVAPRMNEWPEGADPGWLFDAVCPLYDPEECPPYKYHCWDEFALEALEEGFRITWDYCVRVEVLLDMTGRVIRAKTEYSGGA